MAIQIRIADILLGAIPYFGWSGVLGYTIGVLIANTMSPLGPIDLLSAIPSFFGGIVIFLFEKKLKGIGYIIGSTINAFIIAVWVGYMLFLVFNLPLLLSIIYVFIGCVIAMTIMGYILYIALEKRLGGKLGGRE